MTQMSEKRLARMDNQEYRHSFMADMVKSWIFHQIHALRDQRGWTQHELGAKAGKPQSTIARLENTEYSGCSVKTLIELAHAFDVGLSIRFVSWPRFVAEMQDTRVTAMHVESWSKDQFMTRSNISSARSNTIIEFPNRQDRLNQDKPEGGRQRETVLLTHSA